MAKPLPPKFYRRETITVAEELLGKMLYRNQRGVITAGIITETEAYLGIEDPACHTFGNRVTPRVQSMYREGGLSYVYFIYGMHFCFNVVTQKEGVPEAVLIRALKPVVGIDIMRERRRLSANAPENQLCSGPAKLCQALAIGRSEDGLALDGTVIWIEDNLPYGTVRDKILSLPRIGIGYSGDAQHWPLRFSFTPD